MAATKTKKPSTIEITDVGPVERLTIPVPEDGGVVVLRGTNGVGKSTTLRAVERLATGKKDIVVDARDGTASGQVVGFGATLRVGRSLTRTGELEVETIEGRLSIADLVNPKMKGAEEADARRIKSLIQLAGVAPDVKLFEGITDDPKQFHALMEASGLDADTDDLLLLASRVVRACGVQAKAFEDKAVKLTADADAAKGLATGVPETGEYAGTTEEQLAKALEEAIRHQQALATQATTAAEQRRAAEQAKASLDKLKKDESALTLAEATKIHDSAELSKRTAYDFLTTAQSQLEKTKTEYNTAANKVANAENDVKNAAKREADIAAWEKQVEKFKETAMLPEPKLIDEATAAVAKTREAVTSGAGVRKAIEHRSRAATIKEQAAQASLTASRIRDAAAKVDDVLSAQIAAIGCPLTVRGQRLYTKTSKRGLTLFADLSEGERWKMAFEVAAGMLDEHGLLVIPQEAWDGIAPENRSLICAQAKAKKILVLTAESVDGDMTAEEMVAETLDRR